jgi:predicted transcriptional regulator
MHFKLKKPKSSQINLPRYIASIHMSINQIAKMTASSDLKDLVSKDLLTSEKQGRHVYYYGTEKIRELFKSS